MTVFRPHWSWGDILCPSQVGQTMHLPRFYFTALGSSQHLCFQNFQTFYSAHNLLRSDFTSSNPPQKDLYWWVLSKYHLWNPTPWSCYIYMGKILLSHETMDHASMYKKSDFVFCHDYGVHSCLTLVVVSFNKYLFLPNLEQYCNLSQFGHHNFINIHLWRLMNFQFELKGFSVFQQASIDFIAPVKSWHMSESMVHKDEKNYHQHTTSFVILYHWQLIYNWFANTSSIEFKNSKKDQIAALFPSFANHQPWSKRSKYPNKFGMQLPSS